MSDCYVVIVSDEQESTRAIVISGFSGDATPIEMARAIAADMGLSFVSIVPIADFIGQDFYELVTL